jgi:hypothetical protein
MTDHFVQAARTMARSCGMPDYPFAVIPHPISSDGDGELRAKAAVAVQQCEMILVQRRAPVEA